MNTKRIDIFSILTFNQQRDLEHLKDLYRFRYCLDTEMIGLAEHCSKNASCSLK